jgi:chloramphenicol 3-O-phosphotransferase
MQHQRDDRIVFLITGPSAAGKSTVGRLLAQRFQRGVHLEGDVFRRSIVSGRHEMTPNPSVEAMGQLRLRYRLGAVVADAYFDAGFTVVLEDVIAGQLLSECAALIRARPLEVVVLVPSIETLVARETSREASGYGRWSIGQLYEAFMADTPRIGLWLDSSGQTPDETVEAILIQASRGKDTKLRAPKRV